MDEACIITILKEIASRGVMTEQQLKAFITIPDEVFHSAISILSGDKNRLICHVYAKENSYMITVEGLQWVKLFAGK